MANNTAPKKVIKKLTEEEQVAAYIANLEPQAKADINTVRSIILNANIKLHERIKWNAPSYYYKEDIVTFGPYKTHKLLLVFHHPAIVKVNSELLEGNYKDRRLVHFRDQQAAIKNKVELVRIINELIQFIDNK